MIKSMTGFGRYEVTENNRKFTVEMKSVNHRYLDIGVKLPRKLAFFEVAIRNELKNHISRGKLDVFVSYEDFTENDVSVRYNKEIAGVYFRYLKQMAEDFDLVDDVKVSVLAKFPEVFTMAEQGVDEEELLKSLLKAVRGAMECFVHTREVEGEHLKQDMLKKLEGMHSLVDSISEHSPLIIQEYHKKLKEKVMELLQDTMVDEGRLLTEVTLFADRICVDEEVVRLLSHIASAQKTLEEKGGVGRKLDFIAQEMNREANTILSKANNLDITGYAIELKTEIEKVREQIQNIE